MSDPKIKYDIEADVKGQGDVGQLATLVEKLAQTLDGELKSSALSSVGALRELANKDGAIQAFFDLKREARQAATELRTAQAAAQKYGTEIAAVATPTRAQAGQMEKLRDAVRTAKEQVVAKSVALNQSRDALVLYGIGTTNLSEKHAALKKAIAEARAGVESTVPAWQASAQAAAASATSQARSHRAIKSGVDSISEQLSFLTKAAGAYTSASQFSGMIKDVAATADAYNNLAARVELATGKGAQFTQSFAAVQDIALRTNSSLEATGTLFARITDAGKSAGLSAQAAQAQALELTESINQAVQLSGTTAHASDAAITQLIQGLQSGVLRGDEFNSVMEQSPRLAKALADGLGVTTGELRKMAEAGQLSAGTVIKAIQSQSDTLKSEFASLPPTVGRAMQNLSTAWTVYIGETDKATGASANAAKAINALADNLQTVAGYLIDLGQAVAAFTALRLAQHFLGIQTAAAASATAVAANATAMAATTTAASGAAVALGRMVAILRTLRTFTLIGLIANLQDIGVWLGEGIAKLQGYKDKSAELEAQDKRNAQAAQERGKALRDMAAATEAAASAQLGLSKQGAELIAKFDEMRSKGDSASKAIASIGKDFDLSTLPGIKDAATVLNALVRQGKLSAAEFEQAWAQALKGQDLQEFSAKATEALRSTTDGFKRLAQVNDAILRESVRRVQGEYDTLAGVSSKAAQSAINDTDRMIAGLDKLKAQGVNTAAALTASIGKGIDTASTQKDLDTIKTQIEKVRTVLGNKVADGLLDQAKHKAEDLRKKLEDLTPGIQSAQEAMRQLGVTSDAELKKVATSAQDAYDTLKNSGTASARELREAFQKAAQAAIEANNGVAPSWVAAQAASRGYRIEVDEAGKATLRLADANKKTEDSMRGQAAATDAATDALERQIAAQERANQLAERAAELERKRRGVDKEGFTTDKNGNRLAAGGDLNTLTGIAAFLKSAGVDDDATARKLAREFADENGNVSYNKNPGQRKYGGETMSESLLKAAESYTFGVGANAKQTGVGQTPSTIPKAYTVNVNIGGSTTSIATVSDADAQRLISLLQSAKLSSGL